VTDHAVGEAGAKAPDLHSILNPSQLEAATHEGGPLLIIAGAGSGKTRTLVHRVAWLVSRGEDPRRILLLTFTRKAAGEMLTRCADLVGQEAGRVSGGTFHSIANVLLRTEHRLIGYPAGFGILPQDDAETMISRIRETVPAAKSAKGFPKKGKILQVISRSVNKEMSVKDTVREYFSHLQEFVKPIEEIARRYGETKIRQAVMDFDDLLVNLANLMRHEPEARDRIAARYSHVLVDEYQDTNPVQARITWHLARDHRNVTAVGDDAQSIYGFRGADFTNIMDFPKIFDPVKIIKLEDNYRSYGSILAVANGVFRGAKRKYEKTLRAARGGGPPPLAVVTEDLRGEAAWAGARIDELVRTGTDPSEIAVLFRAAAHSFELEVMLTRLNIPFTKYGGRRFLEGAHVKDFLSFFRIAHNPSDVTSLMRVLELMPGVGAKGAAAAAFWVGGDRSRLMDIAGAGLRPRGQEGALLFSRLAALLASICRGGDDMGTRPREILDFYRLVIGELYPDDFPDRLEDIQEVVGMAEECGSLDTYLTDVTLDPPNTVSRGDAGAGIRRDVTLSTIHSAKGLEWGRVFVLSAVDGRIPSSYSVHSEEQMEEERRLFYVAVTRAKDELYLMCPSQVAGGWEGPVMAAPTRFLKDLDDGALDVIENGRKVDFRSLFPEPWKDQEGDGGFSDDDFSWGQGFSGDGQLADQPPLLIPPPELPVREKKVRWMPVPRGSDVVSEPAPGERVKHGAFGLGTVLSFRDGKAVIDFDSCGRKVIVCRHARLTRAEGE
jgi:DNA helicase-2/ATP-dependent DNA helicase PcrA